MEGSGPLQSSSVFLEAFFVSLVCFPHSTFAAPRIFTLPGCTFNLHSGSRLAGVSSHHGGGGRRECVDQRFDLQLRSRVAVICMSPPRACLTSAERDPAT